MFILEMRNNEFRVTDQCDLMEIFVLLYRSCVRLCRKISERFPKEQMKKRVKLDDFSRMIFDEDEDFSFIKGYTLHGYEDRHYLQKILFSVKRPNVVFPLNSEDIQILSTPTNFYDKLKVFP